MEAKQNPLITFEMLSKEYSCLKANQPVKKDTEKLYAVKRKGGHPKWQPLNRIV